MEASTTSTLEDAHVKALDAVVYKRLKFVLKIIKSLISQPNVRHRQGHVYVLEVLDALGDWSGSAHGEIRDFIDMQMFPNICRLISTFSKVEFDEFQLFYIKYIFSRLANTCNFIALDFLADLYGFIARIAPPPVTVELIQVFQQEEIPPQISLVILPSIIKNIPDSVINDVADKVSRHFLRLQKDNISSQHLKPLMTAWINMRKSVTKLSSVYQLTPILYRCIATSFFLDCLEDADLLKVLQSLLDWGESSDTEANPEGFTVVAALFLHSINSSSAVQNKRNIDIFSAVNSLMKRMIVITERITNYRIRVFITKLVQKTLEYSSNSNDEVLNELLTSNQEFVDDSKIVSANNNTLLDALESSVQQISCNVKVNEPERKRIRLMIDSLQNLLDE